MALFFARIYTVCKSNGRRLPYRDARELCSESVNVHFDDDALSASTTSGLKNHDFFLLSGHLTTEVCKTACGKVIA